jgi:1-aminocyclopropane-1-carboxylate deaminase/D-cysteine desulfhydrase-like pyridoxal-dependent ACC family enzyme
VRNLFKNYNKTFENKIRLGIMSALIVNDQLNFNSLKQILNATDGNLASHMNYLEKKKYVKHHKEFLGRKTNTKYSITNLGRSSFLDHIKTLEKVLELTKTKNK